MIFNVLMDKSKKKRKETILKKKPSTETRLIEKKKRDYPGSV